MTFIKHPMPPIQPTPKEARTEGYWEILNTVEDPEIGVGIVDLGLIYTVEIGEDKSHVMMSLTSMACPAGPELIGRVEEEMKAITGGKPCTVEVVWEPVWNPDMIDPDIRIMLGM